MIFYTPKQGSTPLAEERIFQSTGFFPVRLVEVFYTY